MMSTTSQSDHSKKLRSKLYPVYRGCLRKLKTLLQVKFVTTHLYQHSLQRIPYIEPRLNCVVQKLDETNIQLLHEIWLVPLDKMQERLARGDECYLVFADNKPAYYQWIQYSGQHRVLPAGRQAKVHPNNPVVYHVRTAEWARGNRINPYAYTWLLQQLIRTGAKSVWVYTTKDNIASQKSIERAGWQLTTKHHALRIGDTYIPLPRI